MSSKLPKNQPLSNPFSKDKTDAQNSFPELEALPFKYADIEEHVQPLPTSQPKAYYTTPPVNGYTPKTHKQPNFSDLGITRTRKDMSNFWKNTTYIMIGVLVMMVVVLLAWTAPQFGSQGAVLSTALAIIPFVLILLTVNWIGKWDPEPWGLRLGAFFYGAVGSILLTFGISMLSDLVLGPANNMFEAAAIQAPIIEEFAKGIGLLALAFGFKKYINSPVDGMVFMALIAGGFAFTENILYFGRSYVEGDILALGFTFFIRGIMSPFAHVIFSLPMGIIVGYLVTKKTHWFKVTLGFLSMYPIAVVLHALWNGASVVSTAQEAWNIFYIFIQVPLFIAFIIYALWLRKQEAINTLRRTTEYAHAGWFTQPEVDAYATWVGRNRTIAWVKITGNPKAKKLVRQILKDIVSLSNVRNLLVTSVAEKHKDTLLEEEKLLLKEISTAKFEVSQLIQKR